LIVLSIEPGQYPIGGFRIFIECAAEESDVRLSGRGDVYVSPGAPFVVELQTQHPENPTAFDRVDDRSFPEDVC